MKLPILVNNGKYYSSLEPLPEKPECDGLCIIINNYLQHSLKCFERRAAHEQDLSKWRIEVEDQKAVDGALFAIGVLKIGKPIPDGLYFIEVKEAKVVEQLKTISDTWVDCYGEKRPDIEEENPILTYRKVIRITP